MGIKRLLIATGDEKKRSVFNELLITGGYDLFFAFSPEETLELINTHKGGFDLLILDYSFLDNGAESCLKEIKSHPLYKRIPIMGLFSQDNIQSFIDSDNELDDLLVTGMQANVLKTRISRLLNAVDMENNSKSNISPLKEGEKSDGSKFLFDINFIPSSIRSRFNLLSFFDVYRIVDVETKFVYHFDQNGDLVKEDVHCYETWKRSIPCVNCISKSCLLRKQEYIKVEHFQASTFIIAALPINLKGKDYSIEFVKDATSELLLADHNFNINLTMSAYLKHMNDLSGRDLFSGLHNKAYINQALDNCLVEKQDIEVAFLDIDAFKQVNDQYGHLLGDEVIFYLSSLLLSLDEKKGFTAGRVGGDEFLVFSRGGEDLKGFMKQTIDEFENHVFSRDSEEFRLTISVGFTKSQADDTVSSLLGRVDEQMYSIKQIKHQVKLK